MNVPCFLLKQTSENAIKQILWCHYYKLKLTTRLKIIELLPKVFTVSSVVEVDSFSYWDVAFFTKLAKKSLRNSLKSFQSSDYRWHCLLLWHHDIMEQLLWWGPELVDLVPGVGATPLRAECFQRRLLCFIPLDLKVQVYRCKHLWSTSVPEQWV